MRKITLLKNKTMNKLQAIVGDDFLTFKDFAPDDFNNKHVLKTSSAVARFVDYRLYQGKSLIEALEESFTLSVSVRTFRVIAVRHKAQIQDICKKNGFSSENLSSKILNVMNRKGKAWLVLQHLRGKTAKCKCCSKFIFKGPDFCSKACAVKYEQMAKQVLENSPEVMRLIDDLNVKPKKQEWMHTDYFYKVYETNYVFRKWYGVHQMEKCKRYNIDVHELLNPKYKESEKYLYKEYKNYIKSTGMTEAMLAKQYNNGIDVQIPQDVNIMSILYVLADKYSEQINDYADFADTKDVLANKRSEEFYKIFERNAVFREYFKERNAKRRKELGMDVRELAKEENREHEMVIFKGYIDWIEQSGKTEEELASTYGTVKRNASISLVKAILNTKYRFVA